MSDLVKRFALVRNRVFEELDGVEHLDLVAALLVVAEVLETQRVEITSASDGIEGKL